jgi:hypothetical protein
MALGAHRRTDVFIAGSITLCGPPALSLEPIRSGCGGDGRVGAFCQHIPAAKGARNDRHRNKNQATATAFERAHKPVFGPDNVGPFAIQFGRRLFGPRKMSLIFRADFFWVRF